MSRHVIRQMLILHQHPISENHASLSLLSQDAGLMTAIAHGVRSQKSSLRPRCQTYSLVKAWLFEDTHRHSWKVTDLEVVADYLDIRSNLHALYHAAACAEVLIKTALQAEDAWAFNLYLLYLERLDSLVVKASSDNSQKVLPNKIAAATIQFLWRYLGFTGYQADPDRCLASGMAIAGDEAAAYSFSLGGFVRVQFAQTGQKTLPAGALQCLRYAKSHDFLSSCELGISPESRNALMAWLLDQVQDIIGSRLKSLQNQEFLFFMS